MRAALNAVVCPLLHTDALRACEIPRARAARRNPAISSSPSGVRPLPNPTLARRDFSKDSGADATSARRGTWGVRKRRLTQVSESSTRQPCGEVRAIRRGVAGKRSDVGKGESSLVSMVRKEFDSPSHHEILEELPRHENSSTPRKGRRSAELDWEISGTVSLRSTGIAQG